jgi:enoyl-CoA hydratase/carnithine racemase
VSCVLFNEHLTQDGKKIIEITLNAEKALNALAFEMIKLIQPALERYRNDDTVAAIILDSTGEKAFCAGGDIVSLYHMLQKEEGVTDAIDYFSSEYYLDYSIHTYPKPIIAWGAGIVMGGGLGLLSGCSHRVVTQSTMIAMPEVTIGLYPDVGASWFLNRCPGRTGLFLGITGQRINGADAKFIGIADRQLDNEQKAEFLTQLLNADLADNNSAHSQINQILKQLESHSQASAQSSPVREHFDLIQTLTDVDSAYGFVDSLLNLETDDSWVNKAQKAVKHGSPLSIAMIYRQLQSTSHLSLKEAFISELALTTQCCAIGEIKEGVRALLVDKDGKPDWHFKRIDLVEEEFLDKMFADPFAGDKQFENILLAM